MGIEDMTLHLCIRCGNYRKAKWGDSTTDEDCQSCIPAPEIVEWYNKLLIRTGSSVAEHVRHRINRPGP